MKNTVTLVGNVGKPFVERIDRAGHDTLAELLAKPVLEIFELHASLPGGLEAIGEGIECPGIMLLLGLVFRPTVGETFLVKFGIGHVEQLVLAGGLFDRPCRPTRLAHNHVGKAHARQCRMPCVTGQHGRANLEPCDFLSMSRQLIHLKDGHDSAPLSHLWNQGLVATQSFVADAKFRSDFRKAIGARERKFSRSGFTALLPDGRTKPMPANFTIVFGVMRHPSARSKSLDLPFFSKIALRAVAQRLELMGFAVELHLIAKI